MTLQKWGGIAAIVQAGIYVFGMALFLSVLDASGLQDPGLRLGFLIENRDLFFLGYVIIGIVFSFALIVLVQATYRRFAQPFPELVACNAVVGHIWACLVLAAYMIALIGLNATAAYYPQDPEMALTVHRAVEVVSNALGGGIEIVGAVWVLGISYVGLKGRIYSAWLHRWGVVVGVAGVLTLFSGLSFMSANPVFEGMAAIFGLGQIFWFIGLGVAMLNEGDDAAEVGP